MFVGACFSKGPEVGVSSHPSTTIRAAADARWLQSAIEASYGEWPAPIRDRVQVNAIVPAVAARDAQRIGAGKWLLGCEGESRR